MSRSSAVLARKPPRRDRPRQIYQQVSSSATLLRSREEPFRGDAGESSCMRSASCRNAVAKCLSKNQAAAVIKTYPKFIRSLRARPSGSGGVAGTRLGGSVALDGLTPVLGKTHTDQRECFDLSADGR